MEILWRIVLLFGLARMLGMTRIAMKTFAAFVNLIELLTFRFVVNFFCRTTINDNLVVVFRSMFVFKI